MGQLNGTDYILKNEEITMNKLTLKKLLLGGGLGLVSTVVLAAGAPVANQFAGGQPASASQVNANFQELADRIDAIPGAAVYDYRDFGSTNTVRTYNVKGSICGGFAVTEERSFTRTPVSGGTQIVVVRKRMDSTPAICHWTSFTYLATPTDIRLLSKNRYDLAGTLTSTETMNPPILIRTASMAKGSKFGSASVVTETPVSGPAVSPSDVVVNTGTALGLEDVTVPAGSYTGCLKLNTSRQSGRNGAFDRISWYCAGAGEVKRLQVDPSGQFRIWELSTITP